MSAGKSRGLRSNNPGNIRRQAGVQWKGMSVDQSSDPEFVVFEAPEYGIRAMARVLRNYRLKHGLKTVQQVIDRWAPPSENDTAAYIRHVAEQLGVRPDEEIDLRDPAVLMKLIPAIIRHENGSQPYEVATIQSGIDLA